MPHCALAYGTRFGAPNVSQCRWALEAIALVSLVSGCLLSHSVIFVDGHHISLRISLAARHISPIQAQAPSFSTSAATQGNTTLHTTYIYSVLHTNANR